MSVAELLFQLRAGAAVVMLVWASYLDLKERRVRNRFWFPWLWLAGGFWIVQFGLGSAVPWTQIAIAVVSCGAFYAFWWVGILFGGADAKGLMVLALLVPTAFLLPDGITPALDTLVNGVVLTLTVPVGFFLWNVVRGRFAGLATLLAVPMPLAAARQRFVWPMERVTEDGSVRRVLLQRRGDDLPVIYDELEAAGVAVVWATPKIPFMVPMTLGLVVALLWGNLLLGAMPMVLTR